jgi:cystathionine gamma-synthase/methionine-gamma-lyase
LSRSGDQISPETLAVHAGRRTGPAGFRGTSPPIEASSAFLADSVEELYGVFRGEPGVVYSRLGNPTVRALEEALCRLEAGAGAVAYGSGMAAIHAAWLACGVSRDDAVVVSRDCYGSTLTLMRGVLERLGVRSFEVAAVDGQATAQLIAREHPRVVHCEVVSNPLLNVADIDTLAEASHAVGAKLVVDATFTPPTLFRSLEHGADLAVHSLTKYLGGHGDVIGGVCVAADPGLVTALVDTRTTTGAILSPFDAWLTLRGIRTLPLRMERHCTNALAVARFLETQPTVERVFYPGLESHPQHDRAQRLLPGGRGGMVSFELRDGRPENAMRFLAALELIQPATTLGDVASLALHPASSSHRDLSDDELQAFGIAKGLVRISVGIERIEDIIADLQGALQ